MRTRLTRTARRDIEGIRKFTTARWGRDQWLSYYAGLLAAFDRIVVDPQAGRPRNAIHLGLRSLIVGQHTIFFSPVRRAGGAVVIVRILHQKRNLDAMSFADDLED